MMVIFFMRVPEWNGAILRHRRPPGVFIGNPQAAQPAARNRSAFYGDDMRLDFAVHGAAAEPAGDRVAAIGRFAEPRRIARFDFIS
jgi:hypothetical protein